MKIQIERSMPEMIEEARLISLSIHKNAMYGIYPYEKHTSDVVKLLIDHGYSGIHLIAAWLHDGIEDGSLTYRKILRTFGIEVAEIVLAVTDPSDVRSREEAKAIVIKKILAYPDAAPTKVADRIANFIMGIRERNSSKLKMYLHEQAEFSILEDLVKDSLWDTLDSCVILAKAVLSGIKLEQKSETKSI